MCRGIFFVDSEEEMMKTCMQLFADFWVR
jgi:hypothetical protein